MPDELVYTVESSVAWVTLNRPEALNALNAILRESLANAFVRFNADASAKVLVLTGAGDRAFCSGGDLNEMASTGLRVPPPDFVPQPGRTVDVAKPVIAAVNGVAYGGGFLLAQSCDLCIAADHATFAITEARWGRGAPWAAPLPRLIPPRVAMELMLTGAPIDAKRAYEVGLVNEVVSAAKLRERAQTVAETIARNAPLSVLALKRMIQMSMEHPRSHALALAEDLFEKVYLSDDAQEGPRAFSERRAPSWSGH